MLIGPPGPARDVRRSSTGVRERPAGNMLASRGSATLQGTAHLPAASGLLITTGGKLVSCGGALVECRCLNAVMVATGSSCPIRTSSAPGTDPREVTPTQFTLVPVPKMRAASSCMLSQVSGEA